MESVFYYCNKLLLIDQLLHYVSFHLNQILKDIEILFIDYLRHLYL